MLARGVKRVLPVAARTVGAKVHRTAPRAATSAVASAAHLRSNFLGSIRNYSARQELLQHLNQTIAEENAPNDETAELDQLLATNGWKLKLDASTGVMLTRFSSDGEEIVVRVFTEEDMEHDEDHHHHHHHEEAAGEAAEEGAAEDNPMAGQNDRFEISVTLGTRSDKALRFDCVAKDGVIFIRRIGVTSAQNDPIDGKPKVHAVMQFDELPEQTQTLMENYLMERSVNQDFARIVFLALNRHDSKSFVNWMNHVNTFLH
eukprot:TRINITY_DN7587_c0_g1_i1.p1 TRINITY_DN7587_c0_g1~~TRINITY_DN7587_c0_g1_i1.p1  ORF type:complete len:260 (+),score=69.89 TRINITY_DN7587_c0_g1_i1:21-800(+)